MTQKPTHGTHSSPTSQSLPSSPLMLLDPQTGTPANRSSVFGQPRCLSTSNCTTELGSVPICNAGLDYAQLLEITTTNTMPLSLRDIKCLQQSRLKLFLELSARIITPMEKCLLLLLEQDSFCCLYLYRSSKISSSTKASV